MCAITHTIEVAHGLITFDGVVLKLVFESHFAVLLLASPRGWPRRGRRHFFVLTGGGVTCVDTKKT